jgi:RND family efflux transporter MFP subunit
MRRLQPAGRSIWSQLLKAFCCHLFILAFLLQACDNGETEKMHSNEAVPVKAQQIRQVTVDEEISASGNVEGIRTVKLGFMVAGKVDYISGDEGSVIERGQLLASLEPENYEIAKAIADAKLDQAQDEFNRISLMHARKSVSDGDYVKVCNALKLAKAQQRLQVKNLSDTKLYSPIKGVLLRKGTEVGEIIASGMPLFVISDIRRVKVNTAIPETDLRHITLGSTAHVYFPSLDSSSKGTVVEIGSLAERTTRSFSVKIEVENPTLLIRPGMTAEIKIVPGSRREIIAIPGESVLRDLDDSSFVYVVDTVKKLAFKRKISLGRITGNRIEVTSGIIPGELVVVAGHHKLIDGSSVTLK